MSHMKNKQITQGLLIVLLTWLLVGCGESITTKRDSPISKTLIPSTTVKTPTTVPVQQQGSDLLSDLFPMMRNIQADNILNVQILHQIGDGALIDAFYANDQQTIIAVSENSFTLFDRESLERKGAYPFNVSLLDVGYLPEENSLIGLGSDFIIRRWSVDQPETGQVLQSLAEVFQSNLIYSQIYLSPSGKYAAIDASSNPNLLFYDIFANREVYQSDSGTDARNILYSPTERFVIIPGTGQIVDLHNGMLQCELVDRSLNWQENNWAFNEDETLLAIFHPRTAYSSQDYGIEIWDPQSCSQISTLEIHESSQLGYEPSVEWMRFQPQTGQLVAYMETKQFFFYQPETLDLQESPFTLLEQISTDIFTGAKFREDGQQIIWPDNLTGNVWLLSVVNDEQKTIPGTFLGTQWDSSGEWITFSNDGEYLIHWSRNGVVDIWNVADGTLHLQISPPLGTPSEAFLDGLAVSSKYNQLALARSGSIQVIDVESGQELYRLQMQNPDVCNFLGVSISGGANLSFAPDGERLAAVLNCGAAEQIHVWDITTGTVVATIDYSLDEINSNLEFTADGRFLVFLTDQNDYRLIIWDVEENKEQMQWQGVAGSEQFLLVDTLPGDDPIILHTSFVNSPSYQTLYTISSTGSLEKRQEITAYLTPSCARNPIALQEQEVFLCIEGIVSILEMQEGQSWMSVEGLRQLDLWKQDNNYQYMFDGLDTDRFDEIREHPLFLEQAATGAVNPDRTRIATLDRFGTIKIWGLP